MIGALEMNEFTHAEETAADAGTVLFYNIFAAVGVAGKTGADAGTAPDGFARADKIRHRKLVSETFCIAFTAEIINDQRIVPEFIGGFPESIVGIQTENF